MKLEIYTSVVLRRRNGSEHCKCDFKNQKSAIDYFDSKIRLNEFVEGYIRVNIKKG